MSKTRTRYLIEVQTKAGAPYQFALFFTTAPKAQMVAEYLRDYGGYTGVRVLKVVEEIAWSWERGKETKEAE